MIATVSLGRLDRIKQGRDDNGKRLYITHNVTTEDLDAIIKCVLTALGLKNLTKHL